MRLLLFGPAIVDYCVEYTNALSKRANTTLIAPERFFKEHAKFLDSSVDVRLLNWPRHRSLANVIFVHRLIWLIKSLRPDIVHFLSEGVIWLNLIVPFAKRHGLVTTMHDVSYHPGDRLSRRVPRRFADRLVLQSDRVIVHGAGLRGDAEQKYPELKGKIEVLPHLQLRRYAEFARENGLQRRKDSAVNVLFFGRISGYKGLGVLIRSIPIVTASFGDIRVTIAGEGDDIEGYVNMIVDPRFFEVRNRHIPDDETAQLFTDADIVVLPYLEASQSGVLAIASAFGKPVIVTDVGELGRTVRNGISGVVVPAGDTQALAHAILRLATDSALRTQLGNGNRAAAEQAASPDLVADGAIRIYERVIRAKIG
jgi:glycosyltransferase involved in cell wall biosynthesis